MTITSKPAGVSQHRRTGQYSLHLREQGKGNIDEDLKENGIYVANITAAIKSVPKYVLGALAANALLQVISMGTKHDSSRAAANWDLAISSYAPVRTYLHPLAYGESSPTFGRIGEKGSAGEFKGQVLRYKQTFYGIGPVPGGVYQAKPGGLLYNAMGIGKQGTPRVDLFNPIAGDLNQRRAGDHYVGKTYAYYAFRGAMDSTLPGLEKAHQDIGNGYIPYLLQSLATFIKGRHAKGAIPKL
jgi:hypothetical protein